MNTHIKCLLKLIFATPLILVGLLLTAAYMPFIFVLMVADITCCEVDWGAWYTEAPLFHIMSWYKEL